MYWRRRVFSTLKELALDGSPFAFLFIRLTPCFLRPPLLLLAPTPLPPLVPTRSPPMVLAVEPQARKLSLDSLKDEQHLTSRSTCLSSTFGNCCSSAGWCGSVDAYCGTGCQTGFGNCGSNDATPATTSQAAPEPTKEAGGQVSTDGTCAGTSGFTCSGSAFGNCCSQYNWCGSTSDHCGASCNAAFGTCGESQPVSTPTPAQEETPTQASETPAGNGPQSGGSKCPTGIWGQWMHRFGWC